MSLLNPLDELLELDRSSRGFPNKLAGILAVKGCMDKVQDLPHRDLVEVVELLDSGLEQIEHLEDFNRCLFELRRICGAHKVLPKSHIHRCAHLDVSEGLPISGVIADMYEGSFEHQKFHVKRLRVYSRNPSENLEPFYREAIVWKRIGHPNIVPFQGATVNPYQLILDRMENGGLMDFLKKHPAANRLGLLNDVAEGLNYLHSRNVVHGNIMGAVVFVDHFSRARIGDFTSAVVHSSQSTSHGAAVSHETSARWAAPEVITEKGQPSKKADVFSFAMLMIEVFTGRVPFDGFPPPQPAIKIAKGERPDQPNHPLLTDDVWKLIQKCWKEKKKLRPDMETVLRDLTQPLFESLSQYIELPHELQVSLGQFYDSTKLKTYIDELGGGKLKEFVGFLDKVLGMGILVDGTKEQTLSLYHLREVCGKQAILPASCLALREISKRGTQPNAVRKYAEVWRGQTIPERGDGTMDVCLKAIKLDKVHKEFRGDVVVWVRLDHANIVRCFGMVVNPPQIVMEWMPNGQAMKYAQNHRLDRRIPLLIGIACGLEYLHSCGIIHGNLKQENILLDSRGNARLSDIGFAKLVPNGELGFGWAQVGAEGCRWAAPEIFRNGKLTKQSDVFSYGFIAAEIFLGELLWETRNEDEVRSTIAAGGRPSLPSPSGEKDMKFWRIFARCWGIDPISRTLIPEVVTALKYSHFNASPLSRKATDQGDSQRNHEHIDSLDETLHAGMVPPDERPRTLNRLCKLCDSERRLPGLMIVKFASLQQNSTPVARGGFGDVYQGMYGGCKVSIKHVRFYYSDDRDKFLSAFCREAVMWRHLRHPNILPLFAATFDEQDRKFTLISKWMDNGNINDFVKNRKDANRVQLLVDVAYGLQYLHGFGFVHGDLRGGNILVKDDERACLADFGLSTITCIPPRAPEDVATGVSSFPTNHNTSLVHHSPGGSPYWTSPELLHPGRFGCADTRPTIRSDCYAFGIVIYEVLCGKPPYWDRHENDFVVIADILDGARPSKPGPGEMDALGFTGRLWWITECCWLEDRDMRPNIELVLSTLTDAAWTWDMRGSPKVPC